MEVQFNEINWASGVSLNITTRTSDSLASFTGQIEVETSIEIDFPSNENELTFEFQINEGSSKEMEINDASELYNITVRQIQCSNTGKSFSEALIFASVNPQYDKRLFIEFPRKIQV